MDLIQTIRNIILHGLRNNMRFKIGDKVHFVTEFKTKEEGIVIHNRDDEYLEIDLGDGYRGCFGPRERGWKVWCILECPVEIGTTE